ncbi:hypothetical protein [Streptomyces sp. WAC08241]|uniref:hypothetical protein n=1 Tax=Streptomyces sp. WAC08241 TaxID=2487421 RepID=UPI000F785DB2|nr:hypothetical protein [Streptomyces sp. WAC08241]RSS32785.1 hypothetical protein EF906_33225 [Streptomyces sp. WAC08241]
MSELRWRNADVALNDKLIPNPNAAHDLLKSLTNVRVAVEGAFLHIDPQNGEPAHVGQTEWEVYIVPASSVEKIRYRVPALDPIAQIF